MYLEIFPTRSPSSVRQRPYSKVGVHKGAMHRPIVKCLWCYRRRWCCPLVVESVNTTITRAEDSGSFQSYSVAWCMTDAWKEEISSVIVRARPCGVLIQPLTQRTDMTWRHFPEFNRMRRDTLWLQEKKIYIGHFVYIQNLTSMWFSLGIHTNTIGTFFFFLTHFLLNVPVGYTH